MQKIIVKECAKERLDNYLAKETKLTRSYLSRLIKEKHITLNGQAAKCGQILRSGDEIEINAPQISYDIEPQDIPLDIIYEDNDIAAINKQAGISVHPSGKIVKNTLVNAIMFRISGLSGINGVSRPGIVHRLDKDTTGIILIAKNDSAHLGLSKQFASRSVKKLYRALLDGVVKEDTATIDTQISRSKKDRKQMTVSGNGRRAISHFRVIKRFNEYTYAEFSIETGRTHQIRVHARHIGHPVAGDKTYGFKKQRIKLEGQLLHAYSITFIHPSTGKEMHLTAPLPPNFTAVLNKLNSKEEA